METAFIFKKDSEYLGSFAKNDDLSRNYLMKTYIKDSPVILRHDGEFLVQESVLPNDPSYFWAVIENLRAQGFRAYVFEGKRAELAMLLSNSALEKEEKIEFFSSLLSVPAAELDALKDGVNSDLADLT